MEQKDSAERILKQIPYEIVYSARKTLAVQVKADGSVVVRAPKRMAKYKIEAFLKEKEEVRCFSYPIRLSLIIRLK